MNQDFANRKRYEYKELPTKGLIRSLDGIKPFDSVVIPNTLIENHDVWDLFKVEIKVCERNIYRNNWDLAIFHPERTRLTVTANKWYKPEYADRFPTINEDRLKAIQFFMLLINAPIKHIAVENPIGIMSTKYRKPDQIIQPYQFGDTERKSTCLWLKNLPKLNHTNIVTPEIIYHKSGRTDGKLHYDTMKLPKEERRKARSVTFPGIAKAMATQWGEYLLNI